MLDLPYCRDQTYRNPEDARRSFYKWCCKEELYGNLVKVGEFNGRPYYDRRPAKRSYGTGFSRGYPSWEATRSEARKQWENQFNRWREGVFEERVRQRMERRRAEDRVRTSETLKSSQFFRLMGAAGRLSK